MSQDNQIKHVAGSVILPATPNYEGMECVKFRIG